MVDERDEIRARVNIVDLVGQSVQLKKAGKSWKGLCPFHADKNPSFTVDPTFGSYRCWSCGEHGDIFTWVMKTRHVEFGEALQILADIAGIQLGSRQTGPSKSDKTRWLVAMQDALAFFREQLQKNEGAKSYCERRGMSAEVLTTWEIGYAPDVGDALAAHLKRKGHSLPECKALFLVDEDSVGGYFDKFRGRLIFPIRDEAGQLVAFGGRLLGDGHPKYINSGDTPLYRKSKVLYGMHRAKDSLTKRKRAVLVEGYLDVIACHTAGVTEALASLGTSLAEDHARLLKRWCENVIILYDSDAAGQKAADRAVEILQAENLSTRIALMPEGEDPDTLLRNAGPGAVQQAVDSGLRPTDYRIQKIQAVLQPDQEEFWPAVIEVLAEESSELVVDKYVVRLAALSPGATDAVSTQNALRREIGRLRRRRRQSANEEAPPRASNPFRSLQKLKGPEVAVFKGLLDLGLRTLAWSACTTPELFISPDGRAVAKALLEAFPSGLPDTPPASWVGRIQPEDIRETFRIAQYDPRVEQLSQTFLEEAIHRLHAVRQQKELQQAKETMTGDDRLRNLQERLRRKQGIEKGDA